MMSRKAQRTHGKKHTRKASESPYKPLGLDIPPELEVLLYVDPPIHTDIPDFDFPALASNAEGDKYLRNAMIELFNFNQTQACNNFLIAAIHDPTCAFAFWGAAYSVQLNINHIVISPGLLKFAGSSLKRAEELSDHAHTTQLVKDLVHALRFRTVVPGHSLEDPVNWNPSFKQIERMMKSYCKKMARVHRKHSNANVALLYAASILSIHPWKWWPQGSIYEPPKTDVASASTKSAVGILQGILNDYPGHVGAMHYFVHAVEESPHPGVAREVADRLAAVADGTTLSHLVHVPSHIYSRLGLYQRSVDANVKAIAADKRENARIMRKTKQDRIDSYYNIEYFSHNNHFLVVAAQKMGNFGYCEKYLPILEEHVHKYIDMEKNQNTFLEHFLTVRCQVYLRFGKYDEIIALPHPPKDCSLWSAIHSYVKLVSLCKLGEQAKAEDELERFLQANAKFVSEAPKETCRCGCSKRHAGISNPNYGMNKYAFFRKHNVPYDKGEKECKCSHAESGEPEAKPGGLRPAESKPHHLAVTGTLTINNSVLLARIREELCLGYMEWYFGDRKTALGYFKTANEHYEDLQYDEPASFQHEVHNIYGTALLLSGNPDAAVAVVDRGLVPYPNQLDSCFIRVKALEAAGRDSQNARAHLGKLLKFADFKPSLDTF